MTQFYPAKAANQGSYRPRARAALSQPPAATAGARPQLHRATFGTPRRNGGASGICPSFPLASQYTSALVEVMAGGRRMGAPVSSTGDGPLRDTGPSLNRDS